MTDLADRRKRLLESLEQDAFVTYNYEHSDQATLRYLTGFTGEGALIVSRAATLLLTDSRYTDQAERETDGVTISETRNWTRKDLVEAIDKLGVSRVAFPSGRVTFRWAEALREASKAEVVALADPVAPLRLVKSEEELGFLRHAAQITDEALGRLVDEIRIGMTEAEIALRLEWLIRENPASEGISFDLNVSTGPNSALNHYSPFMDPVALREGDLLLFDIGTRVAGYCSDLTRTFSVGSPTEKASGIYDVVLRANLAAIEATTSGATGVAVDAVARDLIAAAGYAENFGHGLGHGIGLEVHEGPRVSPQSEDTLSPGMVVTIEPGIYLSGFGGVRIEDDVVVRDGPCEVISAFPKDRLIEVG